MRIIHIISDYLPTSTEAIAYIASSPCGLRSAWGISVHLPRDIPTSIEDRPDARRMCSANPASHANQVFRFEAAV